MGAVRLMTLSDKRRRFEGRSRRKVVRKSQTDRLDRHKSVLEAACCRDGISAACDLAVVKLGWWRWRWARYLRVRYASLLTAAQTRPDWVSARRPQIGGVIVQGGERQPLCPAQTASKATDCPFHGNTSLNKHYFLDSPGYPSSPCSSR